MLKMLQIQLSNLDKAKVRSPENMLLIMMMTINLVKDQKNGIKKDFGQKKNGPK